MGALEVTFVCHTAQVGGAELGLLRYLESHPPLRDRTLLLEDGPLADRLGERAQVLRVRRPGSNRWAHLARSLVALRRELRAGQGLVVATTLLSAVACALVAPRRRPWVLYLQDGLRDGWLGPRKAAVIERLVLPRAAGYLVNSDWTRDQLPARERRKPVHVVYSPSGDHDAHAPRTDQRTVRVLSLSRLSPWKGQERLMDAVLEANSRPDAPVTRLTIAGGTLFGEEEYAQRLYSHPLVATGVVEFTGHVDDVAALLGAHDVLACPSTLPEPFGQVVVQGLRAGMAVLATRLGGPAEIVVDGESGVLVGESTSAWADALSRVADPARRRQIQEGAVRRAEVFADGAIARLTTDALRALAPTGVGPTPTSTVNEDEGGPRA